MRIRGFIERVSHQSIAAFTYVSGTVDFTGLEDSRRQAEMSGDRLGVLETRRIINPCLSG
jgi:hypothetical protein